MERIAIDTGIYIFSAGFAAAIAILHFLLYLFYPQQRANLFFSIFAAGIVLRQFTSDVLRPFNYGGNVATLIVIAKEFSIAVIVFAFVLFLYSAFARRISALFWVALTGWALLVIVDAVYVPFPGIRFSGLLLGGFFLFEAVRTIIQALIKRQDGARIIGFGVVLLMMALVKDMTLALAHTSLPSFWSILINQTAVLGMITVNSVFLARNFARTNKELEAQIVQVKELAERELQHERTAAELRLQNEQEHARLALMEQEMALAASIQQELFPKRLPTIPGYDVAAHSRPARVCGGDYYDVLAISQAGEAGQRGSRYLLCVADVSGKGLPASLLMSSMQATLRALAGRVESLTELAARTNDLLHATSPSNKFVTAILLMVDPVTGSAQYVNAGHNECVLMRNGQGEPELLKSTGLPLGMLPSMSYEEGYLEIKPGDLLALYSDGVPEAQNTAEEEWGESRLVQHLRTVKGQPAEEVVKGIFDEIDDFAVGASQYDDITLLILKPGMA